jgi:hypothetical protein
MPNTVVSQAAFGTDRVQAHTVTIDTVDTWINILTLTPDRMHHVVGFLGTSLPVGTLTFRFTASDTDATTAGGFDFPMAFPAAATFIARPDRRRHSEYLFRGLNGQALWFRASAACSFTVFTSSPVTTTIEA